MSDNPPRGRLAGVVERLQRLYPRMIDLRTDRLWRLLAQLGNPQDRLPPVIHVAGTNGKGSTCAFLRAMAEAAGMRVHVFISPHLVRFNERIRIAGRLVDDETLEAMFDEIEALNLGMPVTVFEVLTAAALTLYARHPADLCLLEVGLGGRHDATNVVARPAACAITSISLDHRELLGPTLERIAFEKAGIIKPGVPVVTGAQPGSVLDVFAAEAALKGAELRARGTAWDIAPHGGGLRYRDAAGWINLPPPALVGAYQRDNAGIAVAAIRAAGLGIGSGAIAHGIGAATWPARMQRLRGALSRLVPQGWEVWLDGGHNPGGGLALADQLASWRDRPTHVLVGMKQSKDTTEFLRPLIPLAASLWAVAEPLQHAALPVESIVTASGGVARVGPTVIEALAQLPKDGSARVLICGSLYLAGEVLALDGTEVT